MKTAGGRWALPLHFSFKRRSTPRRLSDIRNRYRSRPRFAKGDIVLLVSKAGQQRDGDGNHDRDDDQRQRVVTVPMGGEARLQRRIA
jgi:hypothetical protein